MEAKVQDNLVMPDDSASQVGIGLRNKPKPSECGSRSSRFSKTSSISAARANLVGLFLTSYWFKRKLNLKLIQKCCNHFRNRQVKNVSPIHFDP